MSTTAIQMLTEIEFDEHRMNALIDNDLMSCDEFVTQLDAAIAHSYERFNALGLDITEFRLESMALRIIRIVCTSKDGITLSNLVGQVRHSDEPEEIGLIGELICHLSEKDMFDMHMNKFNYVDVYPTFLCDISVLEDIHMKGRMPPMICEPKKLTKNDSSPYLLIESGSVILKKGNHHDGELCLDSINRFNAIAFSLDIESLNGQCAEHDYLIEYGNKFYLQHNYDKRGRTYCSGYATDYQGAEYSKSIINLHQQEIVEGF